MTNHIQAERTWLHRGLRTVVLSILLLSTTGRAEAQPTSEPADESELCSRYAEPSTWPSGAPEGLDEGVVSAGFRCVQEGGWAW
ncbi:MAG: hypothetical protein KC561_07145, partial [Myxococcales bacterium]|nr:hypothetical protein [Myxococcales bacterium]